MASSEEIRLRIVEALARHATAQAMGDTVAFLQRVAEIETFVLGSQPKPNQGAAPAVTKPARKVKSDVDFMS